MTTKRTSMAHARVTRRRARKAAPMTPQRAMQGPYVAPSGTHRAGAANAEALQALVEVLGSPPVRGQLYRVGMFQGLEGRRVHFIGEYLGMAQEQWIDEKGQAQLVEPALRFAIRNPVFPVGANGTREDPLVLWPLDIWHLSPAQPGDLETPMHYGVEGEESGRTPGRSRIQ